MVAGVDLSMRKAINDHMQNDVTDISYVASAMETVVNFMKQEFCLIILEFQLAVENDMELLHTIRQTKHTPIMVLTEQLKAEEKITLFHAGADACVEKPVNMDVFTVQAEALIRLYLAAAMNCGEHSPIIHGEELIISPRYRQVIIDGKFLTLTRKEFDLFHFLASYPGQVFSCVQLYSRVWADEFAISVDEVVKSQIKRLRRKLSSVGKDYIQNEWGVGYKFVLSKDE